MGKAWTRQEDEFLKEHIGEIPYKKIGEKIGRTEYAVTNRASKIKRNMKKATTKKWLNEYLPLVSSTLGIISIKKKLNISKTKAEKLYKRWRQNYVNRIA